MPDAAQTELPQLVSNAVKVVDGDSLAHYVRWNFKNLLGALRAADITAEEFMAINVILAQALSRKLAATHSAEATAEVGMVRPLRLVKVDGKVVKEGAVIKPAN